jgi:hypothetical protein
VQRLREYFAAEGVPRVLVSDNGPQFISSEFEEFLKSNGVQHIRSAPYHPASNGLAERFVGTFKGFMKRAERKNGLKPLHVGLFQYRSTPHPVTGSTPALLFKGRELRTRWEAMKDNGQSVPVRSAKRVDDVKNGKEESRDPTRKFNVGALVWAKIELHSPASPRWEKAVVTHVLGPVTYRARRTDGRSRKYHINQIKARFPATTEDQPELPPQPLPPPPASPPASPARSESSGADTEDFRSPTASPPPPLSPTPPPPLRMSGRQRRPTQFYRPGME